MIYNNTKNTATEIKYNYLNYYNQPTELSRFRRIVIHCQTTLKIIGLAAKLLWHVLVDTINYPRMKKKEFFLQLHNPAQEFNFSNYQHLPKPTESMISYTYSGGRFGDCLLSYLHAKWLEHKYQLPLAYTPFEYSHELQMHRTEKQIDLTQFKQVHIHHKENQFEKLSKQSLTQRKKDLALHSICYFPESPSERGPNYSGAYLDVDWNNQGFKNELKKVVAPNESLSLVTPPPGRVSIAIHWRSGSGGDNPTTRNFWPCKFPPDQYYADQLLRICQTYPGQPLYVHLFTDDRNPSQLQNNLISKLREKGFTGDIVFGHGSSPQSKNAMLEDFFSMARNFKCLIRAESAYSIATQYIGDHDIVIGPTRFHTEVDQIKEDIVIDQITIYEKGKQSKAENASYRFPFNRTHLPIETFLQYHRNMFGMTTPKDSLWQRTVGKIKSWVRKIF